MPNTATTPGAGLVDIEVVRGTAWTATVTVPYLLTGSTVTLVTDDGSISVSLSFADGVSTSVITLTIPASATAALSARRSDYRLLRTPSGSDSVPIFTGVLEVTTK